MDTARSLQYSINVKAETSQAQSGLKDLVSGFGQLDNKTISVKADTSQAKASIRDLVSDCGNLSSKSETIGSSFRKSFLQGMDSGESFSSSLKSGVGGAVENIKGKVSDLGSSFSNTVNHISDSMGHGMDALEQKISHPIETLKNGLGDVAKAAQGKFTDMARSAEETADSVKELGSASESSRPGVRGIGDDAESSGGKFGLLKSALGTAGKGAAVAMGLAVGAVGAFSTASVKTGMDFDSAMSQVSATMGMTSSDIANNTSFFNLSLF